MYKLLNAMTKKLINLDYLIRHSSILSEQITKNRDSKVARSDFAAKCLIPTLNESNPPQRDHYQP